VRATPELVQAPLYGVGRAMTNVCTRAADLEYSTESRPSREPEKGRHRGKGSRHSGHQDHYEGQH